METNTLTRRQVRCVDRIAIEEFGMLGLVLMESAGRGCAELLLDRLDLHASPQVVICCGPGNNGGDGYVVARHLENAGVAVVVLVFAEFDQLSGDALTNYLILRKMETSIIHVDAESDVDWHNRFEGATWLVDALLGTGPTADLRVPYPQIIEAMNRFDGPVMSLDLPTGLHCDQGHPLNACIEAELTATFVAEKAGFANPAARRYTGEVHVVDIGVPHQVIRQVVGSSDFQT